MTQMSKVFEHQWIRFVYNDQMVVGRTFYNGSNWMVGCVRESGTTFIMLFCDVPEPSLLKV